MISPVRSGHVPSEGVSKKSRSVATDAAPRATGGARRSARASGPRIAEYLKMGLIRHALALLLAACCFVPPVRAQPPAPLPRVAIVPGSEDKELSTLADLLI